MNPHGLHSLVHHLAAPISGAGVVGLACAIAGDLPALRKPALVLFVLSALLAFIAYWTREPALELLESGANTSDRLIERYDDACLVSLTLAAMLAVMSGIWLVTYASVELPPEVALFALTIAIFVVGALAWTAHLGEQLIRRESHRHGAHLSHASAHHTA